MQQRGESALILMGIEGGKSGDLIPSLKLAVWGGDGLISGRATDHLQLYSEHGFQAFGPGLDRRPVAVITAGEDP